MDEIGSGGGDKIAGGVNRALQRRAGAPNRLTAERRKLFLDELAATCNATRSARVAGACVDAFYRCRGRDEAFAAAWEANCRSPVRRRLPRPAPRQPG